MQLSPEEQIGFLLKRLQQAFRNLLETRLRRHSTGLSMAHLVTLDLLDGQAGLPGAQLARRITVTPQTMNQMLLRLELAGEIERRPHPANRRADRWFLTDAGRRQLEACRATARPVMTQMLSRLQSTEVTQLRRFLELCVEAVEVYPDTVPKRIGTAKPTAPKRAPRKRADATRKRRA
ncbi:MAG: MarR family transcriptional regulator [Steroidobacteraceae bacterium]